jgi:multiple sugar transport system substrate-binding protein
MILSRIARALLVGAALVAAPLAGARAEMAKTLDQPVTITFYNYNLASAGVGADGTKQLLDEFMAAHPDIKVEGVGVNSADMNSRVQADMAAGRVPDVAQIVFDGFDFIVHNLGAQALEDIVPADELAAHFEGMAPNGLQLGFLDGKTYGLAYTFSTPVLFYNATLFREAGLDPDKPPRTWDEVKQYALQIRDKTGKTGLMTGAIMGSDWMIQGIILSNGGRVLSEDRKTITFAEPPALGAIEMLHDLAVSGAMPNVPMNGTIETMASGNAGMYLQTSALQAVLVAGAKDKWELRAAPMPSFGDKPAKPTNSGSALVIFSQDPVKQRAAWELMKFLTSERGYTIITSKIGYLPLRPDIVDDPQYLAGWVKEHPLVQPNLEQLSRLNPWVPMPGPNYRQILKVMLDAYEEAVFGDGDPAEVMAEAQQRAQDLMPQ